MNQFLHSEYNGLSDSQLTIMLDLNFDECRANWDISCKVTGKGPCQCVESYKFNGKLQPFASRSCRRISREELSRLLELYRSKQSFYTR